MCILVGKAIHSVPLTLCGPVLEITLLGTSYSISGHSLSKYSVRYILWFKIVRIAALDRSEHFRRSRLHMTSPDSAENAVTERCYVQCYARLHGQAGTRRS